MPTPSPFRKGLRESPIFFLKKKIQFSLAPIKKKKRIPDDTLFSILRFWLQR